MGSVFIHLIVILRVLVLDINKKMYLIIVLTKFDNPTNLVKTLPGLKVFEINPQLFVGRRFKNY